MNDINSLPGKTLAELVNSEIPESASTSNVLAQSISLIKKIKTVLENDSLDDFQCIEDIVCIFESYGIPLLGRHDF